MVYEPKFYKCDICGTLLEAITPQCCDELCCCGKEMRLIRPGEDKELYDKHTPVVKREDSYITVCVGRVLHPMSVEHSILWIEVKSKYRAQRVILKKGEDPIATFEVPPKTPVTVYAYCSKHGLWKTRL